jgi:anti-anti-sigma regulatory factor
MVSRSLGNGGFSWVKARPERKGRSTSQMSWKVDDLTITVTKADASRASLQLSGVLDDSSAPALLAGLHEQLEAGRRFVRLDLSALTEVDAAGFAAVVLAHFEFLEQRGTLIIADASAAARDLLHQLELDSILLVVAPLAAARSEWDSRRIA